MLPSPRPGLATKVVAEEVVILDRASGTVHRLNATASVIWNLCDGKNSLDDIAAGLAAAFRRSPNEVLADVQQTIADLKKLNLLDTDQRD